MKKMVVAFKKYFIGKITGSVNFWAKRSVVKCLHVTK